MALPSAIAAQYETLRLAALGDPLPPEARNGLTLLLRRGMWGWARGLSASSVHREPAAAPPPGPSAACERKAVIHVLAALAAPTDDRRAS
jgi:hypothetical protein